MASKEKIIFPPVVENAICCIKRPKGRGRYELYIHNKEVQEFIDQCEISYFSDSGDEKVLGKKTLFKVLEWGKLHSSLLESSFSKKPYQLEDIQNAFHKLATQLKENPLDK